MATLLDMPMGPTHQELKLFHDHWHKCIGRPFHVLPPDQGAKLDSASIVGSQFARADARGASLAGADLTDTNCYGSRFDGADLRGAQFENSILTGECIRPQFMGGCVNAAHAWMPGCSRGDIASVHSRQ